MKHITVIDTYTGKPFRADDVSLAPDGRLYAYRGSDGMELHPDRISEADAARLRETFDH